MPIDFALCLSEARLIFLSSFKVRFRECRLLGNLSTIIGKMDLFFLYSNSLGFCLISASNLGKDGSFVKAPKCRGFSHLRLLFQRSLLVLNLTK